jgi:predicted chitinase
LCKPDRKYIQEPWQLFAGLLRQHELKRKKITINGGQQGFKQRQGNIAIAKVAELSLS